MVVGKFLGSSCSVKEHLVLLQAPRPDAWIAYRHIYMQDSVANVERPPTVDAGQV